MAFEAQHDRHCDIELACCRNDAGCQAVDAQNAAEDVDEDRLHVLVGKQDLEGVLDLFLRRAAAYVEEVGRAAAGVLDDVHGGHRQAGAIDHAGDRAVKLDVVQRVLAGFHFKRIFFGNVAQRLDLRMAEERVVVKGHLGIERKELVVLGGDEGIDLDQRSVRLDESLVEALEEDDGLVHHAGLDVECEGDLAALVRSEPDDRIDLFLIDRGGILGGDFFDLHAAGFRGHED